MTKKTISITRALVELKQAQDRISSAVSEGKFVGIQIGLNAQAKVLNSHVALPAFTSSIQGSFDKVDALIKNRAELKSAIVKSNAVTFVEVLGQRMTVAEAIELKSTAGYRQQYLNTLRHQLATAKAVVDRDNNTLDEAIEKLLTSVLGTDKGKTDPEAYNNIANPQKQAKVRTLIDPAKIEERIEKLQSEIQALNGELDFVLSESNARTTIEVSM